MKLSDGVQKISGSGIGEYIWPSYNKKPIDPISPIDAEENYNRINAPIEEIFTMMQKKSQDGNISPVGNLFQQSA